jgi:Flp pilus assembly protein TadD
MGKAIGAMARANLGEAADLLDALVLDAPGWAEVWNKRATLHFLQERDLESVRDIQRTLALEPRHFGAMSGFGQICLRAGNDVAALVAFQAALALNPNLVPIREALATLERKLHRTLH